MRTRLRMARIVAAMGLLGVVLAGCTGEDAANTGAEDAADSQAAEPGSDAAPGGQEDGAGEAGPAAGQEEGGGSATGSAQADPDAPDARAGRDLIFRASVSLSSDDPDATAREVRDLATTAGGFVSGTQLSRNDLGLLSGTITIRVPAENLDSLLERVSATAAEVTSQERTVEDVTGQVADIESRLRNLRALEEELLVLLTEAREGGNTTQVLEVFDRVGEVRQEIETLEGRRAELGDQVALSTLTVRIEPTPELVASLRSEPDDRPRPWSPGNVAATAWDATVAALQTFVDAAIQLVVFVLPVLLVWLSPIAVILLLVQWWRRRRGPAEGTRPGGPSGGSGSIPPAPVTPGSVRSGARSNDPVRTGSSVEPDAPGGANPSADGDRQGTGDDPDVREGARAP